MKISKHLALVLLSICQLQCFCQDYTKEYESFKKNAEASFYSFRDDCNKKYADFLRTAWGWYEGKTPIPKPKDDNPIPPKPYQDEKHPCPVVINPNPVEPIVIMPQPKPIEPIKEVPQPMDEAVSVLFYGVSPKIRIPKGFASILSNNKPDAIADGWEKLSSDGLNNTIRDCLETRIRYNLCDWAYLQFLDNLCKQYCSDKNSSTLLQAFLYCQSGYQMRLAIDGTDLYLLYGSHHQIFDKGYFSLDGVNFYPYGNPSNSIQICNAKFEGESPMSLYINTEQKVGEELSPIRIICSKTYDIISANTKVPEKLIELYNDYPTSAIGNNPMTRWAMYANVPLAQKTKDILYPALMEAINGENTLVAANKLLNWVQTGFVYEYDDKVWGHDRAFFAEETLYYPYCDCEDRSILFSRLVRDLLGLDVALIYYPGHLATAVCFNEDVKGDAMIINDRKFIVCDPTYIGAPVGAQMPDLEYDKVEAIILKR